MRPPHLTERHTIMKHRIHILGALAIATSLTFAQDEAPKGPKGPGGPGGPGKGRPNPEEVFKKLDTDNNGSLNLDEFKAGPMGQKDPERAAKVFEKLDADDDGALSLEEFKKGRPPRQGGGPGGPGGPGKGRPGKGGGEDAPPPPPAE